VEVSTFPNAVWTPAFFINLTLPWSFFALTNPQVLQRVFILRRREDLRKMIVLFAIFGTLFTVIVTIVGFGAKAGTVQGLLPQIAVQDRVIAELMARMAPALALPLALSIVFASVSTANSILLTLSSMFTRDVLHSRSSTLAGRLIILALATVVAVFALSRPSTLVMLSVASSRILMVFLPLLFGVFYLDRGGRWSATLTLVGGLGAALLLGRFLPSWSSVATLLSASLLFVVGHRIDHRREIIPSG
jgi:SSS family solute:Na+ symporter